jgi:diguanylate cyclase (GGDEF)-like protein
MADPKHHPTGTESLKDLDASSWDPGQILGDTNLERPIPIKVLLLSLAALAIPVFTALAFPSFSGGDTGLLIWLTALIPAFLLTYYRGWSGASLALGLGMVALIVTQIALAVAGMHVDNWALLAGVIFVFISTCLGVGWVTELLHVERRKAERAALADPLTGIPNRRHAVVFVEAAFAAAQRGIPLCAVLFDVDNFKAYNDTHGHFAGDEALKEVARVLIGSTRRMNLTARWGGEEFVSLLSDTTVEGAMVFTERALEAVRKSFPDGSVTLSAGVARYLPGMDTPARILSAADKAMYAAKSEGGDRARVASEVEPGTSAG